MLVHRNRHSPNTFFRLYKRTSIQLTLNNQFGGFQGGPGGSSLFGLFIEHGPFSVDANLNLVERNHTWTATHSVLYVDNPVGTGFSFTEKDACYATDQNQGPNSIEVFLANILV